MAHADADDFCPVCNNAVSVEVQDLDEDSQEIDCDRCGAGLLVSYELVVEVDVTDVDVVSEPTIKFDCPANGCGNEFQTTEEAGNEEVECHGCGAALEVEWSDWGGHVEVSAPGGNGGEEDEDEEDDNEDDEDGEDEDEEINAR